jgi:hypothetical protein
VVVEEAPPVDEKLPPAPSNEPNGMTKAPSAAARQETPTERSAHQGNHPWRDARVRAMQMGRGTVEVCSLLVAPVGLLPSIGFIASVVLELMCMVPGGMMTDYVNRFHGDLDGSVWQASLALVLHKIIREGFNVAAFVLIGAAAVAVAVFAAGVLGFLAVALSPVALFYVPVALAGVLSVAGGLFGAVRNWLKQLADFAFDRVYVLLTPAYTAPEQQLRDQRNNLIRPGFNIVERALILAASTEVDTEPRLAYAIPVVGAVIKAQEQAAVQKGMVQRLAVEEFQEPRRSLSLVNFTIDALSAAEGGLLALSAMATTVGTVATLAGTSLGGYQLLARNEDWRIGLVGLGFGGAGMVMAGGGLALLAVREIPKRLRPLAIPCTFGLLPDGDWFPSKSAHQEGVPSTTKPSPQPRKTPPVTDTEPNPTGASWDPKSQGVPAAETTEAANTAHAARPFAGRPHGRMR